MEEINGALIPSVQPTGSPNQGKRMWLLVYSGSEDYGPTDFHSELFEKKFDVLARKNILDAANTGNWAYISEIQPHTVE